MEAVEKSATKVQFAWFCIVVVVLAESSWLYLVVVQSAVKLNLIVIPYSIAFIYLVALLIIPY